MSQPISVQIQTEISLLLRRAIIRTVFTWRSSMPPIITKVCRVSIFPQRGIHLSLPFSELYLFKRRIPLLFVYFSNFLERRHFDWKFLPFSFLFPSLSYTFF